MGSSFERRKEKLSKPGIEYKKISLKRGIALILLRK